jgi:hypothetical protein
VEELKIVPHAVIALMVELAKTMGVDLGRSGSDVMVEKALGFPFCIGFAVPSHFPWPVKGSTLSAWR